MRQVYDLHSHSLRSDGAVTPTALVERAYANGVTTLALTDHDVTDGIAEAKDAAERLGISLIPGVEISATWAGRTVHIVGLNLDCNNPRLQDGLAALRAKRRVRAREIGDRLARAGVAGAYDAVRARARGQILSRTHFAQYLVEAGHAADIGKAFKLFLHKGRPGHVPSPWVPVDEAVQWITGAGGTAVIAHPARYKVSAGAMRRLLGEFHESGGRGIEVVSGSHAPADVERFARLAREFALLASAGSDFHDPGIPWRDVGRLAPLPPECEPVWQVWERAEAAVI
jgi:predicted metal-dependent phosphoesterase TrpH